MTRSRSDGLRHAAVLSREVHAKLPECDPDDAHRERGIRFAGPVGIEIAGHEANADEEVLLAVKVADPVKELFGRPCAGQDQRGARFHGVFVEAADHGWIDHGIEQMRARGHRARKPGCAPEDVAEKRANRCIGGEDREQFAGCRHVFQRAVEGGDRAVGIGGTRERHEKLWNQVGQRFPSARGPHGGVTAGVPITHNVRNDVRRSITEAAERVERLGIVGDAREDETARGIVERGRMLEEQGIMMTDAPEVARKNRRKPLQ